MKRPWQQRENWAQAGKALFTLVPVLAFYSVVGGRGLASICAAGNSQFWCTTSFVGYVVVAIVIARLFFLWLKPKPRNGDKSDGT
jgi:hypothetical protein